MQFCGYQIRLRKTTTATPDKTKILSKNNSFEPYPYRESHIWFEKTLCRPDDPAEQKGVDKIEVNLIEERKKLGLVSCTKADESKNTRKIVINGETIMIDENINLFDNKWVTAGKLKSFKELKACEDPSFKAVFEKFHYKFDDEMAFYLD